MKGTAARALGNKMISTDMGARLIPGYDTLLARRARDYGALSYGVIGYGVLAPNSPPVMWVSVGSTIPAVEAQMDSETPGIDPRTDSVIARSDRFTIARRNPNAVSSSRTEPKDVYFDPSADVLRRLAHEFHPEAFVNPKQGTAIALVFDAQDQVIGHAAGVRIADDRDCTDVVKRLLPAFRYRRFLSAGCADAAGQRGPVIVYWESLRTR